MTGTEKKKVARVVDAVQRSLTPDLLRPKYRGDPNPVAGHCAVATEAVYFLLGGKESGLTPTQMSIEGDTHWFLRAKDGSIIDPTASQFSCPVPYEQGRGRGFPTPKRGLAVQPPSARAQKVMDRARRLLGENLAGLPKRGRVPLAGVVEDLGIMLKSGKRDGMPVVRALWNGEEVGFVGHSGCAKGQYAQIEDAFVSPRVRGMGVYPALLSALRDKVKKKGCKGLISNDRTPEATASWERFAEREPRVRRQGDTFMLEGLPKRGRIPLATAKRALTKLGRKAKACGITASALRDGMEVEREHRDVTRGGALKTARIATAHLCESPRYYRELRKMEKRLKRR